MASGIQVVEENTFLRVVDPNEDDFDVLFRTMSDPLGRRQKDGSTVTSLIKLPQVLEPFDDVQESKEDESTTDSGGDVSQATAWVVETPPPSPRDSHHEHKISKLSIADHLSSSQTDGEDQSPMNANEVCHNAINQDRICNNDTSDLCVDQSWHQTGPSQGVCMVAAPVAVSPQGIGILAHSCVPSVSPMPYSTVALEGMTQPAMMASTQPVMINNSHPMQPAMMTTMQAPAPFTGPSANNLGYMIPTGGVVGMPPLVAPAHLVITPGPSYFPSSVPMEKHGPHFGNDHRFHEENSQTGRLSEDRRFFTKRRFEGLLSVVTEDKVHSQGIVRYSMQFVGGKLSSADGVGFILSPRLPCSKNIQRIVSIFMNRTGRICIRAHSEVLRCDAEVDPLEIGEWVDLTVDLDRLIATFMVWPASGGRPSTATLNFGSMLESLRPKVPNLPTALNRGYVACVIKHPGVSVRLGS